MTKMTFAAVTGAALAALALGTPALAMAAPSGPGSAQDTVNTLEGSGYEVVLDKLGPAPLELCTVESVRPGDRGIGGFMNRVELQPVYLTARC